MIDATTLIVVGLLILATAIIFLRVGKREAYTHGYHDGWIHCTELFAEELGVEIDKQRKIKGAIMERLREGEES